MAVAAVRRHYAGNGAGQHWGWAAVVEVGGSLGLGLSSLDGGGGDWKRWWWWASTLKTDMVSY